MGASSTRCCEACDPEGEVQGDASPEEVVAKPWSDDVQPQGRPGAAIAGPSQQGRTLLDMLQGKWYRKEDGQPVGDISGAYFVWNPRWQFKEVISPISEDLSGALVIDLENQLHFGRPFFGPETLISWGDGDLWVKK
mmetsp:Transcript_49669/g.118307  ORF Transcript_49669/g.118307 Transcript_49669/m.118307 type:complete len:137 (+) Transcript_49669:63-473(+)